jgi:phenylalanyl-tRNA synthetase beta chain
MLELGQPMHAFDLAAIDKAIVVRFAQAGELITLLNGQTLTLTAQTLIIADQTKPLALAGIMGGQASSVTQGCANIFLESAFFEPQCIAATARQYHLHSDSAYRYERGVDPKLAAKALARATQLILEHCGGAAGPIVQHSQVVAQPTAIVLRHSRVEQLLGIKLNAQSSVESLTRLGCQINSAKKTNTWEVLPPSYRFDLTHEVDLIEEIARIQGYAKIPTILPQAQLAVPSTTNTDISNYRIKTALADLGYQEVISFSFVDPAVQAILCPTEKMLSLSNPIAQDLAAMRTNLWPGLLEIVKRNQSRQQSSGLLFEIGRHFRYIETDLIETEVLSGVGFGQQNVKSWHDLPRNIDFYDMKGHIERLWQTVCGQPLSKLSWLAGGHQALHPGQSAKVMYGESTVGHIGAVHPEVLKKLNLIGPVFVYEFNLALFSQKTSWGFKKPSRFPAIRRDLSLTLSKNCSAEAILNFIRHQVGTLLQDTWIFDVYQGANIAPGQKSLGISLILQEASRTLVETEVEVVMQTLISGLTIEFQAKLRD